MKRIINLEFSLFNTQLNKIELQRSEEARVVFRADVCALNSEMFLFIDESGFVSVQFLFDLLGLNSFHSSNCKIDCCVMLIGQKNFSNLWTQPRWKRCSAKTIQAELGFTSSNFSFGSSEKAHFLVLIISMKCLLDW